MRGMMALENDFYFVERKCVMMLLCVVFCVPFSFLSCVCVVCLLSNVSEEGINDTLL